MMLCDRGEGEMRSRGRAGRESDDEARGAETVAEEKAEGTRGEERKAWTSARAREAFDL